MNANKPVAWIELEAWESGKYPPDDCFAGHPFENAIPLYTHPAELTDEEIYQLWDSCRTGIVYAQIQAFARAILRKAQEKC